MRMAELSAAAAVPVATIKFYLREGLLPAGERTSPNQARYGPGHVRRLRLIRALTDVGGLSLGSVAEVLAAVDDRETGHRIMAVVQAELAGEQPATPAEDTEWALGLIRSAATAAGWPRPHPAQPPVADLVTTLVTARDLGHPELAERLAEYAVLAQRAAEVDLTAAEGVTPVERVVETALLVTVLGDRVFADLRHLAQQHLSRDRLDT